MIKRLSPEQGRWLLSLVRETIGQQLGVTGPKRVVCQDEEVLEQEACGSFVTLKMQGALRGCIGNLEPAGSLLDALKKNGLAAAFHDHRFSPLKVEELSGVEVEISLLSPPERLEYRDADDLLEKLRPGIDGVILEQGKGRATFLPQVWEQLPDPVDFLGHLCRKAGLQPTAWQQSNVDIFLYQVQSFKEERR